MNESWVDILKFPVVIEGAENEASGWEVVYTAEKREQFEFQINSYKFPVFPLMRIRDASGQTFEVSQSQLLDYNEKASARTNEENRTLESISEGCT